MRQLSGRVAVVAGAASGIGRALATRFAAEGMRCVLADVEAELRWMKTNVPIVPGPGVARHADTDARP